LNNQKIINLNLKNVLEIYKFAEQREYQIKCIEEIIEYLKKGIDIMLNLPTGTGKTFIYAPIAIETSNLGLRVCIISATKYIQNKIKNELSIFPNGDSGQLIYGISEYHCLLTGQTPTYLFCNEKRKECEKLNIKCENIEKDKFYQNSNLIITNFSKFLSTWLNNIYDLIIIDDSHCFENVKEQSFQFSIKYYLLDRIYNENKDNEHLKFILGEFLDEFDRIFERGLVPNETYGAISADFIKDIRNKILKDINEEELTQIIMNIKGSDYNVLQELYWFLKACNRTTQFTFYLKKDYYEPNNVGISELIARVSEEDQRRRILNKFSNARIIYVTATPGDIEKHILACSNRIYKDETTYHISPQEVPIVIQNWFKNLKIYLISDIGDTRKSEEFEKASDLALTILKKIRRKSLLLFKNYLDQNKANKLLKDKIADICFIEESYTTEEVQELVNKKSIIIATASSRLWEGVHIENLYLGIIFTPPFIQPPVYIPRRNSYPFNERLMITRLQQGIGRIIRDENASGICVLMDSNFKKYVNKSNFNKYLRKQIINIDSNSLLKVIKEE